MLLRDMNNLSIYSASPYKGDDGVIAEVTKITDGNCILIPATIRKSLELLIGDAVTLVLQNNGEVHLLI